MNGVRVLVGTKKGAFVLTSDGKRERWEVSGPHFGGWEVFHVKGSPVDTNRLYAAQWEALTNGLPQRDVYVDVLRDALAVDTLDPCGVYFGTTGAQVYASADAGDHWKPIVQTLPKVLSVEVQTLP